MRLWRVPLRHGALGIGRLVVSPVSPMQRVQVMQMAFAEVQVMK